MITHKTETEHLKFRTIEIGDENIIFPEIDESLTSHWIGWEPPKNLGELRINIEDVIGQGKKDDFNVEFMVFAKSTNEFIGCCGISPTEHHGEYEAGLWVKKSAQRRGYGKEMIRMLIDWAKKNTNLKYIVCSITEGNLASEGIIKRVNHYFLREYVATKRDVKRRVVDYAINLR